MKAWRPITIGSIVALGFGYPSAANSAHAPLNLTRDGQPAAAIVVAEKPTKAAQFAAFELQWHVKAISGATLPILRDAAKVPVGHARMYVGDGPWAGSRGLTQDKFQLQEYAVRSGSNEVVLVGKDADDPTAVKYDLDALNDGQKNANWPGFWEERGTLHAVYDFLQDGCGVRWFNPTDTGALIPRQPTLTVKPMDLRRAPTFRYRDAESYGSSYDNVISSYAWANEGPKKEAFTALEAAAFADLHRRYPDLPGNDYAHAKRQTLALYLLRMRNGGEMCRCNHSLYGYYSRFWAQSKDPNAAKEFVAKRTDMFAKGYEGDEPPQMCYTSTALVEQVAQDAKTYFAKGETRWGANYFAVEPMDNSSFCRCPACQELIARGKDYGAVESGQQGMHSDYFFQFVNAVQQQFAKTQTQPGKSLVTLAYGTHAWPPQSITLDPRVAVQFCFASSGSPGNAEYYKSDLQLLQKWSRESASSGRPLYLWLYNMNRQLSNAYGRYYCFPDFYGHTIASQMKLFKKRGYRGMFYCGNGLEVDAYLSFRLMDNSDLDVDQLLDEYFAAQYGAAARPMKELYLRLEKTYTDPKSYPAHAGVGGMEVAWGYLGTEKRMAEYGKLLDEARRLTVTDREKRNLDLFDLGIWKCMTAGRAQYLERTSAPIPSAKAPAVPDANGDPVRVAWDKAAELAGSWYQRSSANPAPRKLAGRIAHDKTHLYIELNDPCDTRKLVASPTVACYDDWELYIGAQRGLPYRQFLVGPTGLTVAYLNGEVNWRLFVPFMEHGLKVVSDTSAPDKWVIRIAVPLKEAIPNGAKPDGRIYFNVVRVSSPAVGGTSEYTIASWVPYTTVLEVDRLAEIRLEK